VTSVGNAHGRAGPAIGGGCPNALLEKRHIMLYREYRTFHHVGSLIYQHSAAHQ
jgi:hypothetical protein